MSSLLRTAILLLLTASCTLECARTTSTQVARPTSDAGVNTDSLPPVLAPWPVDQGKLLTLQGALQEFVWSCPWATASELRVPQRCRLLPTTDILSRDEDARLINLVRTSIPEAMEILRYSRTPYLDKALEAATGVSIRETGGWRFEDGSDRVVDLWLIWWSENMARYVEGP